MHQHIARHFLVICTRTKGLQGLISGETHVCYLLELDLELLLAEVWVFGFLDLAVGEELGHYHAVLED